MLGDMPIISMRKNRSCCAANHSSSGRALIHINGCQVPKSTMRHGAVRLEVCANSGGPDGSSGWRPLHHFVRDVKSALAGLGTTTKTTCLKRPWREL
jgi:hypothetical protein